MNFINNLDFNKALGNHTLLYGETSTKKTRTTAEFVRFLLETKKIEENKITILDFGPKFIKFKDFEIGGRITDFYKESVNCIYLNLNGEIIPPRLNARNKKELYDNICHNYKLSNEILLMYNQNPTPYLIINDISIYLHLGSKKILLEIIRKSETFFGNSYYGILIQGKIPSLLSLIEKKRVEFLIENIEKSLRTG
jgi:hypothetical protein